MNVMLDMVISPNGMISREDGNEDWLPSAGWDDFIESSKHFDNIVMGRETYEQVTARYKDYNFDAVPVSNKVIVTRSKDFKVPTGYVVVHSPEEALEYIKQAGCKELFLIGGGVLNAEFAKRKLITHVQLTIAPYILGTGRPFLAPGDYEFDMTLVDVKQLSIGRVRLSYKVNA